MSTILESEFQAAAQMLSPRAALAPVLVAPLVGTWHAINGATPNLVKVVIGASRGGIVLDAFRACTSTSCKWGSAAGVTYAAILSGGAADAFSAQFTSSLSEVLLVGYLHGRYLMVETFTQFTDGSGRTGYYACDTLAR